MSADLGTVADGEGGTSAGQGDGIAFRVTAGRSLMLTEGFVNGRGPFNLAIDTGASMTVISRRAAARARVPRADRVGRAISVAGRSEASFGRLDALEIGTVAARDLDVAIITLSSVSRAVGVRLDGIVGYNFLKAYHVTIDYAAGRLYLRPPGG